MTHAGVVARFFLVALCVGGCRTEDTPSTPPVLPLASEIRAQAYQKPEAEQIADGRRQADEVLREIRSRAIRITTDPSAIHVFEVDLPYVPPQNKRQSVEIRRIVVGELKRAGYDFSWQSFDGDLPLSVMVWID